MGWHWRHALGIVAAALVLFLPGCGNVVVGPGEVGSGDLVTITPDVGEFSRMEVGSAFEVVLSIGEDYGVTLRADDNLIDQVEAAVSGDTLQVRLDGSATSPTLEAEVVVPQQSLRSVTAAGAATITGAESLDADDFAVEAAGASTIRLELAAETLDVDAAGASTVGLRGSAGALTARATGASTLQLFEVQTGEAVVSSVGASTIEVTVSGALDAEAAGASKVVYGGDPGQVRESTSGASTIAPR